MSKMSRIWTAVSSQFSVNLQNNRFWTFGHFYRLLGIFTQSKQSEQNEAMTVILQIIRCNLALILSIFHKNSIFIRKKYFVKLYKISKTITKSMLSENIITYEIIILLGDLKRISIKIVIYFKYLLFFMVQCSMNEVLRNLEQYGAILVKNFLVKLVNWIC